MILEWGQQDTGLVLTPGLFPLAGFTGESGAVVVVDVDQVSGGWPFPRRKTREEREEEVRQQRIKLGILPPDTVDTDPPEVVKPPKVVRLKTPEPWRLSEAEIERLRQRITSDIDLEIAVHLHEIEKRRLQMLALVLILDSV